MKKHFTLVAFSLSLSCLIAPASAFAASKWKGKSTNMKGNFNYGPVSFTVSGNRIKDFIVEGVTTSGCLSYKSVVVPSGIRIRGNRFSGRYVAVPGLDDVVTVKGTITARKASGTFKEGPLCSNAGKFTAFPTR